MGQIIWFCSKNQAQTSMSYVWCQGGPWFWGQSQMRWKINVKQNQISWPIIWFNSWNWRSSTEKLKAATVASEGFYGSSTRINSVTIISIGFRCCIYSYIPILLLCSCWCLCHLFPKKTFWYGGFGLTIVPAKCDVHLGEKTGYLIIYRWVNTQVWGSLI